MDVAALLLELYGRILPLARQAVEGLGLDDLTTPPAPGANPIAWLIWHLARVQDDHVADRTAACRPSAVRSQSGATLPA